MTRSQTLDTQLRSAVVALHRPPQQEEIDALCELALRISREYVIMANMAVKVERKLHDVVKQQEELNGGEVRAWERDRIGRH